MEVKVRKDSKKPPKHGARSFQERLRLPGTSGYKPGWILAGRPDSLAKLSSPRERVLSTCGYRGVRNRLLSGTVLGSRGCLRYLACFLSLLAWWGGVPGRDAKRNGFRLPAGRGAALWWHPCSCAPLPSWLRSWRWPERHHQERRRHRQEWTRALSAVRPRTRAVSRSGMLLPGKMLRGQRYAMTAGT
jgi:hypothetical protein